MTYIEIKELITTARGLLEEGEYIRRNADTKEEASKANAFFGLSEDTYNMAINCLISERDKALKRIENPPDIPGSVRPNTKCKRFDKEQGIYVEL